MQLQYLATPMFPFRKHVPRRLVLVAFALATPLALTGCSDPASPEQQVRDVISQLELAVEHRDVGALTKHLSADYSDLNGSGPEEAVRYARGYFIANQSIHLLTRVESVDFPSDGEARATVLVGMVGQEADAGSQWDLAADLYEFKIALRRHDDEWQVSFAEWRRR